MRRCRRVPQWAAMVFVCTLVSSASAQQAHIVGHVRDSIGRPIAYANVEVGGSRRVVADDSGRFLIEVGLGRAVTLDFRRIGFRPLRLQFDIGGDTTVTATLNPVAQILSGQTIAASQPRIGLEVSGFYRRLMDREKGINIGHFLTEEDIDRRKPHRITQMLEMIPSVRILPVNTQRLPGRLGQTSRSPCLSDHDPTCWVPVGKNNCPMTVYVNGRRLNSISAPPGMNFAFGVDEVAAPTAISGIEVYASANRIPPEYQPLAGTCGAVLIWTK